MPKKKIVNLRNEKLASELIDHQEETGIQVPPEWLLLAEFGKAYGWMAYKDAVQDKISKDEMLTLIEANRKLESIEELRTTRALFIASIAAGAKKPTSTFEKLTKDMIKQSKADE